MIKTLEIGKETEKILTRWSRYFSPDLSPDGRKIAAVAVSTTNGYALVILDADKGNVLDSIPSPGNRFLQYPAWSANGEQVFLTA